MTEHNTNEEQLIDTTTIEPEYLRVIALRDRQDSIVYSYANAGKLAKYITERMYELGIKQEKEELPETEEELNEGEETYETRETNTSFSIDENIREIEIRNQEVFLSVITELSQTSYGVTEQRDTTFEDGRLKRGGSPLMLSNLYNAEARLMNYFDKNVDREDIPEVNLEYEVNEERPIKYDIYSQKGIYADEGGLSSIQLQRLSMYGLSHQKVKEDIKRNRYLIAGNTSRGLYRTSMGSELNIVVNQPNMYDSCYVCWGRSSESRIFADKLPQDYAEYLATFYDGQLNTDLSGKELTLGAIKRFLTAVKFQFENIYSNPSTNTDYEHDMELLELTNYLLDNITHAINYLADNIQERNDEVTDDNKYILAESAYIAYNIQPYTYLAIRSGVPIDYINQFSYETHQAFLDLDIEI